MGGGVSPTPLPFLFILVLCSFFGLLFADPDSRKTPPPNDIDVTAPSNEFPSPVSNFQQRQDAAPFRPSIAVIVGVLTTLFSVTFLLLLYAKHCKRANGRSNSSGGAGPTTVSARKNSGIDRTVIESLPIFRFGSLSGQKDGLECAVCLTRFETTEVLRLLPKCKHAFHVECVDTWLDAHSTCPLCRYRVEPEDILLIEDARIHHENQLIPPPPRPPAPPPPEAEDPSLKLDDESKRSETVSESRTRGHSTSTPGYRRVSGRHSSAGEKTSEFLEIVLNRPCASERAPGSGCSDDPASFRRSLDSSSLRKKNESVAVGCFDRQQRKDGLLLADGMVADRTSVERRFEHRIIVSTGPRSGGFHQRWSDVQPSDLLYLRSEMIISDSRRFSSALGYRPLVRRQQHQNMQLPLYSNRREGQVELRESTENNNYGHRRSSGSSSGRNVINTRSVSEITGLSRFATRGSNNSSNHQHRERQGGAVSRWLAWVSPSTQPQPAVRSERTVAVV